MNFKLTLPTLCLVLGLVQMGYAGPLATVLKAGVVTNKRIPITNFKLMGDIPRKDLSLKRQYFDESTKETFTDTSLQTGNPLFIERIQTYHTDDSDFSFLNRLVTENKVGQLVTFQVGDTGGVRRSLQLKIDSHRYKLVLPDHIPGKIINVAPIKMNVVALNSFEQPIVVEILGQNGSIKEYTFVIKKIKNEPPGYYSNTGGHEDISEIKSFTAKQLPPKQLDMYRNYHEVVRTDASAANAPAVVKRAEEAAK